MQLLNHFISLGRERYLQLRIESNQCDLSRVSKINVVLSQTHDVLNALPNILIYIQLFAFVYTPAVKIMGSFFNVEHQTGPLVPTGTSLGSEVDLAPVGFIFSLNHFLSG